MRKPSTCVTTATHNDSHSNNDDSMRSDHQQLRPQHDSFSEDRFVNNHQKNLQRRGESETKAKKKRDNKKKPRRQDGFGATRVQGEGIYY